MPFLFFSTYTLSMYFWAINSHPVHHISLAWAAGALLGGNAWIAFIAVRNARRAESRFPATRKV